MRIATALLLLAALFATLGPVSQPAVATLTQSMRASCCVKPEAGDAESDCGEHMPKSQEQQRCCAACNLGQALALDGTARLIAPPAHDENFAPHIFHPRSRSERPPTPPPRRFFS